jgi:hypothetical protein
LYPNYWGQTHGPQETSKRHVAPPKNFLIYILVKQGFAKIEKKRKGKKKLGRERNP